MLEAGGNRGEYVYSLRGRYCRKVLGQSLKVNFAI
jgi:hypothetical protein